MGTSGKCLSVVLSVAGDSDQGGQILRIDVPKIEGKFSGCGDLFTAMCGGNLPSLTYPIQFYSIQYNTIQYNTTQLYYITPHTTLLLVKL